MTGKIPRTPPLTTRRFFKACLNDLGIVTLQNLYKKSRSEIYRWAADPRTNGETRQNPLDRIKRLLEDLYEHGYDDIARAAVRILATAIDCEIKPLEHPVPDKKTVFEECLDDYRPMVKFHEAITNKKKSMDDMDDNEIMYLKEKLVAEINETVERYMEDVMRASP